MADGFLNRLVSVCVLRIFVWSDFWSEVNAMLSRTSAETYHLILPVNPDMSPPNATYIDSVVDSVV
jgi:hypothetical protein